MAKSYFYDESISDWRELVKGEQGERGPVGPIGPQGPAIDIETGLPISVDTTAGTRVFVDDVMVYGSTGQVTITSNWEPLNGWTFEDGSTSMRIYRENNVVMLSGLATNTNATSNRFLKLPVGYRPHRINSSVGTAQRLSTFTVTSLVANSGGELSVYRVADITAGLIYIYGTWITNDPWPTSIP